MSPITQPTRFTMHCYFKKEFKVRILNSHLVVFLIQKALSYITNETLREVLLIERKHYHTIRLSFTIITR